MKKAKIEDRDKVISILRSSFGGNPTLLFLIRSEEQKSRYIDRIARYAFDFAIRRDGVLLSDSGGGVAICFKYNFMKKDILDTFRLLRLVLSAFAIRRLIPILKHSREIELSRPADGEYLYFWFFGVRPEEQPKMSAKELALNIIKLGKKRELDIYAETTIEQNMRVYERFGFEVYRQWRNPYNDIDVWFMRKVQGVV